MDRCTNRDLLVGRLLFHPSCHYFPFAMICLGVLDHYKFFCINQLSCVLQRIEITLAVWVSRSALLPVNLRIGLAPFLF